MNGYIWLGIGICITQSAMFSGLNLAVFSVSRLRLEAAAHAGDRNAARVLRFRRDANFTLATILWGNVSVNVLLTILADSVLAGASAFVFSTVLITFLGEIFPQAYFARNALRMAALLTPWLRAYQVLLWLVAKPTAKMLDAWVGPESIPWFRERELRDVLQQHTRVGGTELSSLEATGAINFLALDDIAIAGEGEPVDPRSIVPLPVRDHRPVMPGFARSADDPFLRQLESSGKKWVIVTDEAGQPRAVLDAHRFLRGALFSGEAFHPDAYWHRPILVTDPRATLGEVIVRMRVQPHNAEDDVIDEDLVLLWTTTDKRIITGSDLLGRLLRGIVKREVKPGPL
jgi:hypothetical protein